MTDITLLLLQILNIIITAIGPVIVSLSYCIKHIKLSQCCGSKIELRESDIEIKK